MLLHPTSLPGPFGIGDLGPQAYAFVDWLAHAGFRYWQVLPLGPTGYGNSPYQCHSVFAGNPNLISPELLSREGLSTASEIGFSEPEASWVRESACRVDFGRVIPWKRGLLRRACVGFDNRASAALRSEFISFRRENSGWLEQFCLFMALKDRYSGSSVLDWPRDARSPKSAAASGLAGDVKDGAMEWAFSQWIFFRQWRQLLKYAHSRGVELIGDAPIFAALDSADVWGNPQLFCLDASGRPAAVSGVPPDYFAPTGQLWGNPLYDWKAHEDSQYEWWIHRARSLLQLVDMVRLDHFRGFAGYWQIPASAPTAESGRWVPGPGEGLLNALVEAIAVSPQAPVLPFIAEDLGVATPDVTRLLLEYDLPGMRVLQFGFTGYQDDFLPHNYPENCVAYTGTHDNDTSRGWFSSASDLERRTALDYLHSSEATIVQDMMRAIWRSRAELTLVPVQDILDLGTEARMNYPGKSQGYWEWRLPLDALTDSLALDLRSLNSKWGRLPPTQADTSD